jgi:tryptophan-rich sensory protein
MFSVSLFLFFIIALLGISLISYGVYGISKAKQNGKWKGGRSMGKLSPWAFQIVWPILFTLQALALTRLFGSSSSSPPFSLAIARVSLIVGILLGWLWLSLPACDNPTVSVLTLVLMTICFFIPTMVMLPSDPVVTLCLIPTVVWLGVTPCLVLSESPRALSSRSHPVPCPPGVTPCLVLPEG